MKMNSGIKKILAFRHFYAQTARFRKTLCIFAAEKFLFYPIMTREMLNNQNSTKRMAQTFGHSNILITLSLL